MKFKVALSPSKEGIAVSVPSLPGCWSQGETEEEALENVAIAIREYLEADVEPDERVESREVEVAIYSGPRANCPQVRKKGTGSRPWLNLPHQRFGWWAVCLSPFSVRIASVIRCKRRIGVICDFFP